MSLLSERDPSLPDVWSCGGGTQSAAIAALIVRGDLPKPAYATIVDTEREKSTTWTYYEETLRPALVAVGIDLVRLPKSQFATVDLYAHNGDLLLPAFTAPNGKLPTYCSNEWKRRVLQRYLRSVGIKRCNLWLGMSSDEMRRVRQSTEKWASHWYPLIERGLRRVDCVRLVESLGWPTPPRSSCWMCPNMRASEWSELTPDDREKAIAIEREIRQKDSGLYLHSSRVTLDMVKDNEEFDFEGCASGMCFV
jgi:hypothetical protein